MTLSLAESQILNAARRASAEGRHYVPPSPRIALTAERLAARGHLARVPFTRDQYEIPPSLPLTSADTPPKGAPPGWGGRMVPARAVTRVSVLAERRKRATALFDCELCEQVYEGHAFELAPHRCLKCDPNSVGREVAGEGGHR